jgi:hypothetical protein
MRQKRKGMAIAALWLVLGGVIPQSLILLFDTRTIKDIHGK